MTTVLSLAFALAANVYNDTFEAANKAYAAGNFAEAIRLNEQLVGESVAAPEVFYNLGNAYYRSGRLGPAIANYERALRLDPGFTNARENLNRAVTQTQRRLARPLPPEWEQSLLFWHYNLSRASTHFFAAIFWLAFWGLLTLRLWRRVRYLRTAAALLGVLACAFGASAWAKAQPSNLAVASQEKIEAHYGPAEAETVRFELFEGDRVTVDGRSAGWVRVNTVDGQRGWAPESSFTFVGPPYAIPSTPAEATPQ